MSADDGIYILKTRGGPYRNYAGRPDFYYHITHAQAIENIDYEPNYKGFNLQGLMSYFGHCHMEYSEEDAYKYAREMEERQHKEIGFYPEYGVCLIDASHIDWHEMMDWDCNIGDEHEIRRKVISEMLDITEILKNSGLQSNEIRQWIETPLPGYYLDSGKSPKELIASGKGHDIISTLIALAQGNVCP